MDYKELCKPYSENGRSPEGQRTWLLRKGIAPEFVDKAFLKVYDELEHGLVFTEKEVDGVKLSPGQQLDHYLRDTALAMQKEDAQAQMLRLEAFHNELIRKAQEEMLNKDKPSVWERVKAVFKP